MFRPPFGWPQIELVGDPGAGLNFVYTVGTGLIVQPMGIRFTLTTDATVADRVATLRYQHQAFIVADMPPNASQPASQAYVYTFAPGLMLHTAVPSLEFNTATAHPIWLIPGDTIRSSILGIQVGDAITGIRLYLNQYAA